MFLTKFCIFLVNQTGKPIWLTKKTGASLPLTKFTSCYIEVKDTTCCHLNKMCSAKKVENYIVLLK